MDIFEEKLEHAKPFYLGILGKTEAIDNAKLTTHILRPLVEQWGRYPEKIIQSSEGASSYLINLWAERHQIEIQSLHADYFKLGKRAGFLRDAMILKECTHLLVFLGTKSQKNEEVAIRETKKGKHVFTLHPKTLEITELVLED